MATIKRFEDIRAWQSSRELVNLVYEATRKELLSKDFGLRDQICRAAISVMSNIAEGFNSGSDAEFIRFLGYSRRSISEVQSQAYIALDQGYIDQAFFEQLYEKANLIERQVNALISYLAKSKKSARHSTKEQRAAYVIPDDLSDV